MSSIFNGGGLSLGLFGESHGSMIGCVLQGLPAGQRLSMAALDLQMARRRAQSDGLSTPRREEDKPMIVSGLHDGVTTGAPLAIMIENKDVRSADYAAMAKVPRPGHADYTGRVRYDGRNDPRGGGHFSGRLTAAFVAAGAVCRQILRAKGIVVGAHVQRVAHASDQPFDPVELPESMLETLSQTVFPVLDSEAKARMVRAIEQAKAAQDSVGGVIECGVTGLPAGLGNPIFGGVENVLSPLLFGIPAVKGVEFGAGFGFAGLRGSEANDAYAMEGDRVITKTNHNGGVLGGITGGMPLIFRVCVKPTPSIAAPQQSVDLERGCETELRIEGRHDPCIVPRAVPVVEAMAAVGLLSLMKN